MSGITQKGDRTRWSTNIKEDQMYGKPWWVRPKATNRARWSTNIRKDQVHGKPWWMEEDDGEVHIMTLEEAARVQEIIIGCSDDENPLDTAVTEPEIIECSGDENPLDTAVTEPEIIGCSGDENPLNNAIIFRTTNYVDVVIARQMILIEEEKIYKN